MKDLVRAIEIPRFDKNRLRQMFPGYEVVGDTYGWFYKVDETKIILVSYGWDSLITAVRQHMAGNGIKEPLTLELVMGDFICQYVPDWCEELRPEREAKVSAWKMMKKFYRAVEAAWHLGQVSQEEAERRAAICAQCPMNADQIVDFCIGCSTRDLVAKIAGYMQSKHTSKDQKLKTCAKCGCALKLKVWMRTESMQDSEIEWPSWCWMRASADTDLHLG